MEFAMTKGTKIFRIIISTLLGLTIVLGAFFAYAFVLYVDRDFLDAEYGITVAGVEVTRSNKDDVLGDGTVSYNAAAQLLTFDHAEIQYDDTLVYARIDLMIELVGENKFVLSGDSASAIYAGNSRINKDLVFLGEGSLDVKFEGNCTNAMGIYAGNLKFETDVTITLPDCENIANGIYSEGNMMVMNGSTVTIHNGAGKFCTAVKSCNNIQIEIGSTMNVTVKPGASDICKGFEVNGSLLLWDDATLNVSMDDAAAQSSKCVIVSGLMSVGHNAKVTVSTQKAYSMECYGSVELKKGSNITASTEAEGADILCYGAIMNYGGAVHGEVEALGSTHNSKES
jgi:hypothetical protein